MQSPTTADDSGIVYLSELIDFMAHVADCYPGKMANFPKQLSEMLLTHHRQLETDLREKIVGNLVLLRRKNVIDSST